MPLTALAVPGGLDLLAFVMDVASCGRRRGLAGNGRGRGRGGGTALRREGLDLAQIGGSERGLRAFAVDHRGPGIGVGQGNITPPERLDVLGVERRRAQRPLGICRNLLPPVDDAGWRAEFVDVERDPGVAIRVEPLAQRKRVLFHRGHVVQVWVVSDRVHRADRVQVLLGLVEADAAGVEHAADNRLRRGVDLVKRRACGLVHLRIRGRVGIVQGRRDRPGPSA